MKNRTRIPDEVAAKVLFESDRMCCICRLRGKPVQIHHIDENSSNSDISNLAVLCFDCHRDTQIKGGFDRKLEPRQVILYRDDWIRRVKNRRDINEGPEDISCYVDKSNNDYLNSIKYGTISNDLFVSLPKRRKAAYRKAQPKWDSGITSDMKEGNSIVIEELIEILVDIAKVYPPKHFNGRDPREYFENKAKEFAEWYRLELEPHGAGTGGTIISVLVGGEVISSLENMIEGMIAALTSMHTDYNFQVWKQAWSNERCV